MTEEDNSLLEPGDSPGDAVSEALAFDVSVSPKQIPASAIARGNDMYSWTGKSIRRGGFGATVVKSMQWEDRAERMVKSGFDQDHPFLRQFGSWRHKRTKEGALKGTSTLVGLDPTVQDKFGPSQREYIVQQTPESKRYIRVLADNKAAALEAAVKDKKKRASIKKVGRVAQSRDFLVTWKSGSKTKKYYVVAFDKKDAERKTKLLKAWRDNPRSASISKVERKTPCDRNSSLKKHFMPKKGDSPAVIAEKERRWRRICTSGVYVPSSLYTTSSAKVAKSRKYAPDTMNAVMYLAPASTAYGTMGSAKSVCQYSTKGCREACLNAAGRGGFGEVQYSRINKARLFLLDPQGFVDAMRGDQEKLRKKHLVKGSKVEGETVKFKTIAFRPNGTSDILWERLKGHSGKTIFDDYRRSRGALRNDVVFYDYTKIDPDLRSKPSGITYHLTYSYGGTKPSKKFADRALAKGWPVAAVFRDRKQVDLLLGQWKRSGRGWSLFPGTKVADGDEHDLRFKDGASIVALYAKGPAIADRSGFVQDLSQLEELVAGVIGGSRTAKLRRGKGLKATGRKSRKRMPQRARPGGEGSFGPFAPVDYDIAKSTRRERARLAAARRAARGEAAKKKGKKGKKKAATYDSYGQNAIGALYGEGLSYNEFRSAVKGQGEDVGQLWAEYKIPDAAFRR